MFSGFRFLLRSLAMALALAAPLAAQTVTIGNGTAAAPTLRPIGSPTTGLYRIGPDTLGIATGGLASFGFRGGASPTLFGGAGNMTILAGTGASRLLSLQTTNGSGTPVTIFNASSTQVNMNGASSGVLGQLFQTGDGTASAPSHSFQTNAATGMYCTPGTCQRVNFSANGTHVLQLQSNYVVPQVPIGATDGTAVAPSYTFFNNTGTGFYRFGADTLGIATGGTARTIQTQNGFQPALDNIYGLGSGARRWADIRANTATFSGAITVGSCTGCGGGTSFPLLAPNGSAAAPSYSFSAATNTGMWSNAGNTISFSRGGTDAFIIQTNKNTSITKMEFPNGTAADPAINFYNESGGDLGIYRFGADTLGFTAAGSCSWLMTFGSGAGNLVGCGTGGNSFITAGRAPNVNLTLQSTNASGTPTTFLNGSGAQALFTSGTAAAPSVSFSNSSNLGLYRHNADTLGFAASGRRAAYMVDSQLVVVPGRVGKPSILGATNAGFFFNTNMVSIAVGGGERFIFDGAQFRAETSGAPSTPAVASISDGNTGIWWKGGNTDTVGVATGGTSRLTIANNAATGAGDVAMCLTTSGALNVLRVGATCGSSSAKVKTDIKLLSGDLALALRPVSYTYKTGFYNQRAEFGLIAEEAAKVDPRFAFYAEADQKLPDGSVIKKGEPFNVNDRAVLAALLATVQAQQKKLEALCKAGITPAC